MGEDISTNNIAKFLGEFEIQFAHGLPIKRMSGYFYLFNPNLLKIVIFNKN